MVIAAFDPAQQMAAANFSLAMMGIFTIGLPALLVTRSNKTEENRKILNSTFNPWSREASPSLNLVTVLERLIATRVCNGWNFAFPRSSR